MRRGALRRFAGTGESQWRGYLARIARNVTWDRTRRHGRETRLRQVVQIHYRRVGPQEDRALPPWAGAVEPTPEERVLQREERRVFWRRAVRAAGPDPRYRRRNGAILRRVWVDGWTSREVARALGGRVSPSTVDSLVHRARRRLGVGRAGRRYTPRPSGSRRRRRSRRAGRSPVLG